MNKLFNKIATFTLGLAMAIGVGVAIGGKGSGATRVNASAVSGSGTGELTFSTDHKVTASGNTISDTKSATWTFTTDSGYIALDGGAIHTGSSGQTCSHQTWTTGDYSGVKITSVVVNAKIASSSSGSVSATINGNAIEAAKSLSTTASDYTFTNSSEYTGGNLIVKGYRGSATKKAIYIYSITVNYTVKPVPITAISVSPTSASLAPSGTQNITPTTTPASGYTDTISWWSSDTAVATVSSGTITAVAAGSCTVYCYVDANSNGQWDSGEVNGSVTVSVTNPSTPAVTVSPTSASGYRGQTVTLTATPNEYITPTKYYV